MKEGEKRSHRRHTCVGTGPGNRSVPGCSGHSQVEGATAAAQAGDTSKFGQGPPGQV